MTRVCTLTEVIDSFHTIHGTEKYDYSEVEYVNTNTKVKIFCNICQEFFWQVPASHKKGIGCPKCSKREEMKRRIFTTEDVVKQFQNTHGTKKYDYSEVKYKNLYKIVKIFCNTCGEYFYQSSNNHKRGQGCPKCAKKNAGLCKVLTQKEVIKQFEKVHGDLYDYSKTVYDRDRVSVEIKCNRCGRIFYQKPNDHKSGKGCSVCGRKKAGKKRRRGQDEVIRDFRKVHGMRYIYDFVRYKRSIQKILIVCREHGIFSQTPNTHLSGGGCPICNKAGAFIPAIYGRRNKKALLYIIQILSEKELFYKVGITTKNVKQRYSGLPGEYSYNVIKTYEISGYGARIAEINILKNHKEHRYKPKHYFAGYTECLNKIDLDKINQIYFRCKNKDVDRYEKYKQDFHIN